MHSGSAKSGLLDKCCSNWSSSNCSSSKEPNFRVKPRSVRINPSCEVIISVMSPNRALLRKGQASLGFALHLNERIARREEIRDQDCAAYTRHR